MSVDMLQRKRSTTIPAVLNNRSLGTLVAGTDSSLAAKCNYRPTMTTTAAMNLRP